MAALARGVICVGEITYNNEVSNTRGETTTKWRLVTQRERERRNGRGYLFHQRLDAILDLQKMYAKLART